MAQKNPYEDQPFQPDWPSIQRELKALVEDLEKLGIRLDNILQAVLFLQPRGAGYQPEVTMPMSRLHVARHEAKTNKRKQDLDARKGVDHIHIIPKPDGSAVVSIDSGQFFPLPPGLAVLLQFLSEDCGYQDGQLVGWKTFEEIQAHLFLKLGRMSSRRGVEQLIYRTRKELQQAGGVNPRLVMTHQELGWRFALKKKTRM